MRQESPSFMTGSSQTAQDQQSVGCQHQKKTRRSGWAGRRQGLRRVLGAGLWPAWSCQQRRQLMRQSPVHAEGLRRGHRIDRWKEFFHLSPRDAAPPKSPSCAAADGFDRTQWNAQGLGHGAGGVRAAQRQHLGVQGGCCHGFRSPTAQSRPGCCGRAAQQLAMHRAMGAQVSVVGAQRRACG